MEEKKRYAVDLDLWVYGKNEREAKIKMHDLIKEIKKLGNNEANIKRMTHVPFGVLGDNKIVKDHTDPREVIPF